MPHSAFTAARGPGRTARSVRMRGPWPLRPKAASGDCADRCTHDHPRRAPLVLRDRGRACDINGAHDSPASLPLRLHEPVGAKPGAGTQTPPGATAISLPMTTARSHRARCLSAPPEPRNEGEDGRGPSPTAPAVRARNQRSRLTSQTGRHSLNEWGRGRHPEAGRGLESPLRSRNPPRFAVDWLRFAPRSLTPLPDRSPYA